MNLKEKCLFIATCGTIGSWRFGGILASLIAFPIVFGMKTLYWFDPHLAAITAAALIFLTLVIIHISLNVIAQQDASAIVIDRLIGLSMAFMYVPIALNPYKFILVGFFFFHLLYFFIKSHQWDQLISLSSLPTVVSVVAPSILAGISVQLFFRLMLWIVR